ncbi:phosphoenolpyruvate carboxykinase (ATP) [Dyadobacter aurulentus]|uniref:hypothetical protein n=1 Tax=Dyadobacter sp. UC 10 TaxID=2605428 RepID=UPI0011F2B8AD|nr:hypothetical protein [Dyadobacter sp. UC 10]KAA0993490.1 hypothetical protein FXO21_26590 [Dyadobacter sp. UC 10]
MNPVAYFDNVLSLFDSLSYVHTDQLKLADRTIHLRTPSLALREKFLPTLAHLSDTTEEKKPELTIWYADDNTLPQPMKAPPLEGFNAQGYHADLDQGDIQIFFQPWQTQIFLYSRSKSIGIYWVQQAEQVPWWECTFSFRALFHLWTHALPAQLVHAGTMAKNGIGVLIPGQSGSGKSTSCLNLLRAGYEYLGDDYVWVELGEEIKVFTLYQTAKVEPDNFLTRFSDWEPFLRNKTTFKEQKAIFHVTDIFPEAGISVSPVKAILLPKVAHQEYTGFEKANPTQALMAMAPTTLHHLPYGRTNSYRKLMKVASLLPGYHWNLGTNQKQFVESFDHFLANELS